MLTFERRNRDFCLVWLGQICSQSGGRMYQIAMIWWLVGHGGSTPGKLVGLFMVLAALPSLLLVKAIGRAIDRLSSRRILVVCDALAALTIGTVAVLLAGEWLPLWGAYAAGLAAATLQAFVDPTLNKSITEVVEPVDVEAAVARLSSTQSAANFTGAVLGALLIGKLGTHGTAALAAFGYLISMTASFLARFRFPVVQPIAESGSPELSGWKLLADHPLLKKLLVGFGLINFFSTPTLVVLPIYTSKTLGAGASVLGTLEASLWIGLLAGTFLSRALRYSGSRIRLGGWCTFFMGVCLAVPSVVTALPAYMAALFLAGLALGTSNVKFMALFQEVVAPEMKGRFFALMQALIGFTFPIAYFAFGWLTDFISPPTVCGIQGIGVAILALYFLTLAEQEAELSPSFTPAGASA